MGVAEHIIPEAEEKESKKTKDLFYYFFHLAANHPTLPAIEIKSILKSEQEPFHIEEELPSCIIVKCTPAVAKRVAERAAYCRRVMRLLFSGAAKQKSYDAIVKELTSSIDFLRVVHKQPSFLVRVYRIVNASKHLLSPPLEAAIGKSIFTALKGKIHVDVKEPAVTFVLLFTKERYLFGVEEFAQVKGVFAARRPDLRPFFKPGTLEPRFARLMVNLTQASSTEYVLDPFCGPGGILIEGAMMGLRMIGMDIDPKMVAGAAKNLQHFAPTSDYSLLVGDARKIPLHNQRLQAIVTDPPYGRSTSTFGQKIVPLLEDFFAQAATLVKRNGTVSISIFSEIPIQQLAEAHGFYQEVSEKIYIHRSLTRTIGVFRKQ